MLMICYIRCIASFLFFSLFSSIFCFSTRCSAEAMSVEQEKQQPRQKRELSSHQSTPIQRSPPVESRARQHRGCCRGLAIIFSVTPPPKSRLDRQVEELKEEVQRQIELKAAYKARLDRMQDYLRHCMEIAKENGYLGSRSYDDQQTSPAIEDEHEASPVPEALLLVDPHLAAIRDQARLHGWSIKPQEIVFHEKIGRGTTADIFRGTWRGLDVAVKWIYPRYFKTDENGEAWFAQELETLSRQRHPFVVRFMGACLLPPENAWVVTELMSGKTLTEWLHGHKRRQRERSISLPPLKERIQKGLEIAQAMQYLHEQKPKIIHRDLKPSNILLDDSMHVRVADFGHARFLLDGEQAFTGEMGTQVYMAPEVIRSEPYNEKCDVYSYGIILNELITGEHPYIETGFGPSKIALEVGEEKLRPKLPDDDNGCKELIDLIRHSWDGDASIRPSFQTITSTLRKIQENLTNLHCSSL